MGETVEISFKQTGGAHNKREAEVVWVVETGREGTIQVKNSSKGEWDEYGKLNVTNARLKESTFSNGTWEILEWEENGIKYTLEVEGPIQEEGGTYYYMKIKRSGTVVDDSLLSEMPEISY